MASLDICGLQLDEDRQMCRVDNQNDVELTGTEFRLLRYFMSHPGKLLSKSRLTEHVYEFEDERDSNVIEAYVTGSDRKSVATDSNQTWTGVHLLPVTSIQNRLALWLSGSVLVLLCIHLWITRQAPPASKKTTCPDSSNRKPNG